MTKSHGRKSRARNKSRSRGAAYSAANAGTLHQHDSGPSGKDLQPADPTRWGVASAPDMRTTAGLIGACVERCAPCRESLTAKLLDDEDPVALAMAAGAVYNLRVIHEPDAKGPGTRPLLIFYLLVKHARLHAGDARLLTETVERMPRADRAVLLEAALELWAYYGPEVLGLMRGPGGLSDLTAISDLATARPGAEADVHHVSGDHPKAENDPADQAAVRREWDSTRLCATSPVSPTRLPVHRPSVTRHPSKEIRIHMNENTEDIAQNAEDAARSLAELVCDLQHQGIAHPLQAHGLYSLLSRCAGEMKTALILLSTFVEELRDQGLLMTDYRGEPLGDVLQRYAESSAAAEELAGVLGEAGSAIEYQRYSEVPGGNGSTNADHFLAVLAADLQHRGIEYPLEAYRIYSFLTRCAGEMRTALALLEASGEVLHCDDVQRYAESTSMAVQLAGVLGKAYSAGTAPADGLATGDGLARRARRRSGPGPGDPARGPDPARCAPDEIGEDCVPATVGLLRETTHAIPVRRIAPAPSRPATPTNRVPPQIVAAFEDLDRHTRVYAQTTALLRTFHETLGARVPERTAVLAEQLSSPDLGSRLDAVRMSGELMRTWRGDRTRLLLLVTDQLTTADQEVAAEAAAVLESCHPVAATLASHVQQLARRQRSATSPA